MLLFLVRRRFLGLWLFVSRRCTAVSAAAAAFLWDDTPNADDFAGIFVHHDDFLAAVMLLLSLLWMMSFLAAKKKKENDTAAHT